MPVSFRWEYVQPIPPCKDCGLDDLPRNTEGRCEWCQELANFQIGHTHNLTTGKWEPVYKYQHQDQHRHSRAYGFGQVYQNRH